VGGGVGGIDDAVDELATRDPQVPQKLAPSAIRAPHLTQNIVPLYSVLWCTYIDWIPILPGPVIRARLMFDPPKKPVVSF